MRSITLLSIAIALCVTMTSLAQPATHTFAIGTNDFLLDSKPLQIRCGEIHFARVPPEYWKQRLQLCKAMGLNTVCAYLFWNRHEFTEGQYDWSGPADAAEFCRLAQAEGLWVILRPGPYACAEWDGGGLPWWLLKKPDIRLRSQDPDFIAASSKWLKEVGRVLGPQQITHGGPILMVQVENEYGSFGNDSEYMGKIRQALLDGGFDVPLFDCDPPNDLRRGYRSDLFQVVNFGRDPQSGFRALRNSQPTGPLMCGEFYPGWFDTWGAPHHLGDTQRYLTDLEYMLSHGASFSIYMAHGGTTFGMWSGADRPFKPDTSSYDYDAPISEAGWIGEKFQLTRNLITKYLAPGETLPEPPPQNPVTAIAPFTLTECAPIFDNLPAPITDTQPRNMEAYDQGHGCILYRTTLPPSDSSVMLQADQVHDFGWVYLDGKQIGVLDRRSRKFQLKLPPHSAEARLDILVEAMGHVNFGNEIHDRKGIEHLEITYEGGLYYRSQNLLIYPLRMDEPLLASLKWQPATADAATAPAFWRGTFTIDHPADTFLDMRNFGKGLVWLNGHCLARYWNIGPSQTAYVPGPWLHTGNNEVIVLDLLGPTQPTLAGLEKPIMDQLRPALDFSRKTGPKGTLLLANLKPDYTGTFPAGTDVQQIMFSAPVTGKQFCIEALSSQDGKPFAAIAELDLLDPSGKSISHANWTIAYADSEELVGEDGSAGNAINGQTADYWHTQWQDAQPGYPHQLIIDLGNDTTIGGFRYTPRPGANAAGHIKDYRIFIAPKLVQETK